MRRLREVLALFRCAGAVLAVLSMVTACGSDRYGGGGPGVDEILRDVRLDLLADDTYYFPANAGEDDATVFLPLRKWDIILAGRMTQKVNTGSAPPLVSRFIPGDYDHVLVYVGKDREGFAYAVELNTDEVSLDGNRVVVTGGHRFLCLGKDFGIAPHPSGALVLDREAYGVRWARTFSPEDRDRLLAADRLLTGTVRDDIMGGFPYEFELRHSGRSFLVDRDLVLVDDGRLNGAGCADYWTSLYEDVAGVCVKGARWSGPEITVYYLADPVGRTAYFPSYLNPLGSGDLLVSSALGLGVRILEDGPHRFSCDGTEETGLVLPTGFLRSETLRDIPPLAAIP